MRRAFMREFKQVPVEENLVIEFVATGEQLPSLAGIEVVRE